ncbi:hypothetical protein HK100_000198, partial [Physocladia obscura]
FLYRIDDSRVEERFLMALDFYDFEIPLHRVKVITEDDVLKLNGPECSTSTNKENLLNHYHSLYLVR